MYDNTAYLCYSSEHFEPPAIKSRPTLCPTLHQAHQVSASLHFPECIKFAMLFIFVDDTKCLITVRSTTDTDKLQEDINITTDWSHSTNLLFNIAKFSHICFLPKSSINPDTSVNGNLIKTIFTADLNWTEHYKIIIARAYQTLGLIRCTFRINCVEAKKQLYIALVRSRLFYCSQLWRPQLIKDITMLERVQRRATKYILNADYTSTYKSRLQQLQMLPLMYIYEFNDLMFFIKSLKFPTTSVSTFHLLTAILDLEII